MLKVAPINQFWHENIVNKKKPDLSVAIKYKQLALVFIELAALYTSREHSLDTVNKLHAICRPRAERELPGTLQHHDMYEWHHLLSYQ
jgi:hypothetical protein